MIGRFPTIVARARIPLAAPNISSQGLVFMRRSQKPVQEAEHPESTVATARGREEIDCEADLKALVISESLGVDEQTVLEVAFDQSLEFSRAS